MAVLQHDLNLLPWPGRLLLENGTVASRVRVEWSRVVRMIESVSIVFESLRGRG